MNGFDILAPVYDRLVTLIFGKKLHHASIAHFDLLKDGDDVLIIGGGTGKLLEEIKSSNIKVTYVEQSEGMIKKARMRTTSCKVDFINDSYLNTPEKGYDVIVVPFFLDLFTTPKVEDVILFLQAKLKIGGVFLFIDFNNPRQLWQKSLLWIMYRFFRITCRIQTSKLPNFASVFPPTLKLKDEKYFYGGMIVSRVYLKSDVRNLKSEI